MIWFSKLFPWKLSALIFCSFSVMILIVESALALVIGSVFRTYTGLEQVLSVVGTNSMALVILSVVMIFVSRFFLLSSLEKIKQKTSRRLVTNIGIEYLNQFHELSPEAFHEFTQFYSLSHQMSVTLVQAGASITMFYQILFSTSLFIIGLSYLIISFGSGIFVLGLFLSPGVFVIYITRHKLNSAFAESNTAHQEFLAFFSDSVHDFYKNILQVSKLKIVANLVVEKINFFIGKSQAANIATIRISQFIECIIVIGLVIFVSTITESSNLLLGPIEVLGVVVFRTVGAARNLASVVPRYLGTSSYGKSLLSTRKYLDKLLAREVVHQPRIDLPALLDQGGKIIEIVGPSGFGKTTVVENFLFRRPKIIDVRYAPQDPTVSFLKTNLLLAGLDLKVFLEAIEDSEIFEIDFIERLQARKFDVSHLSGGERKRLSVLMAFEGGVRYVFLDEPFANLDDLNIAKVKKFIMRKSVELTDLTVVILGHRKHFSA